MKLAFMSSVLPKASLAELLAAGESHGYEGLEFRPEWKHGHGIELEASSAERSEAAKRLGDSPIEPCCLSPGVKFISDEPGARDAELEKLHRYVDLAAEVGISRIRVFADTLPAGGRGARARSYEAQSQYLARGAEKASSVGVRLVLETHSNFRAFDTGEVLFRAGYPKGLWVNWHLGHCLRHGEDVDEAYRHVKGRVGHCHFSFGEGGVQQDAIARQLELLRDDGFDEFFSVEVIDPDDGQAVLSRHVTTWRELSATLGL